MLCSSTGGFHSGAILAVVTLRRLPAYFRTSGNEETPWGACARLARRRSLPRADVGARGHMGSFVADEPAALALSVSKCSRRVASTPRSQFHFRQATPGTAAPSLALNAFHAASAFGPT